MVISTKYGRVFCCCKKCDILAYFALLMACARTAILVFAVNRLFIAPALRLFFKLLYELESCHQCFVCRLLQFTIPSQRGAPNATFQLLLANCCCCRRYKVYVSTTSYLTTINTEQLAFYRQSYFL
jgi:hypothetical protein